jgi:hypothetical protein
LLVLETDGSHAVKQLEDSGEETSDLRFSLATAIISAAARVSDYDAMVDPITRLGQGCKDAGDSAPDWVAGTLSWLAQYRGGVLPAHVALALVEALYFVLAATFDTSAEVQAQKALYGLKRLAESTKDDAVAKAVLRVLQTVSAGVPASPPGTRTQTPPVAEP